MLVSALAGCGTSSAPSTGSTHKSIQLRFSWWGSNSRDKHFLKAIALFEKAHPGVTISPQYGGSKGYVTKLHAELAANEAPDVFVNGIGGPWAISTSYRRPLNGLGIDVSHISPEMLAEVTINRKLQGVPNHIPIEAVLYNRTLFHKLGIAVPPPTWTWNDFAKVAEAVYAKTHGKVAGAVDVTGGFAPVNQAFEEFVLAESGHNVVNAHGLSASAATLTQALMWWQTLRNRGAVTSAEVTASLGVTQNEAVVKGVAAMDFVDVSTFTRFQSETKDQLGLLPMPNGPYPSSWAKAGNIYSIAANSPHPHTAAAFINFLVNNPQAVKAIGVSWGVPASTTAQKVLASDSHLSAADKLTFTFTQYVEQHVHFVPQPEQPLAAAQFFKLLNQVEQRVAFNKETVTEAVHTLMTKGAADFKS